MKAETPYIHLHERKRTWTPVQVSAGTLLDGGEEVVQRALALRCLEIPVGDFIADAMKGVSNQADKVRLAEKLFGARGASVLQMMDQGAEGIRKMREEADQLGLTLSQEGANSVAAFNDQLARLKARFPAIRYRNLSAACFPGGNIHSRWFRWSKPDKP